MKIDIRPILYDHFRSLKNETTQKPSYLDYLVFYGGPVLVAGFMYQESIGLDRDSYNASITFFGIFIALLLNIQMAIFSIYQRKWKKEDSEIEKGLQEDDLEIRRRLLEQLNSNISYLVLICCISLIVALSIYILKSKDNLCSALMVALYAHFILTMLMIVKRAHALFQREYREYESRD